MVRFHLLLCVVIALWLGYDAAPTEISDQTLERLVRLLVDKANTEDDLEMESRQVNFVSVQAHSLTLYLQRNRQNSNPEFRVTWNPSTVKSDGTTVNTATVRYNDDPENHKFRIGNLTPGTTYKLVVCRTVRDDEPELCTPERSYTTKSANSVN